MHILETPIPAELIEALEAHFAEEGLVCWGIEATPNGSTVLKGFFETVDDIAPAREALTAIFPNLAFSQSEIPDRQWQDAYKAFLKPWSCGRLHWIPAWERDQRQLPAGHVALYFDAGMAFGTGSHETTRLMARRLMEYRDAVGPDFTHRRVIDAGCGSGILALSAALLGNTRSYGFDQDLEAIRVSEENREGNGIPADRVSFAEAGIEGGLAGEQADLLLANIQADVLMIHAEGIMAAVAAGGTLALSGILAQELDTVQKHFHACVQDRAHEVDSRTDGEWSDLCYTFAS
ncbi:MAG: 50S ribosomal protein L11 methyltransferase [Verrucomicrobiota bacterium]